MTHLDCMLRRAPHGPLRPPQQLQRLLPLVSLVAPLQPPRHHSAARLLALSVLAAAPRHLPVVDQPRPLARW